MHNPVGREPTDGAIVQIGASGPDSRLPSLLYAFLQVINLAEREILITTPYFIPNDSLLDALLFAALSGVSVKLLVPGKSDSRLVNAAANSYYSDLLNAGVEIYRYQKGFVHAKTLVADGRLAAVGTANLDNRSFDMNLRGGGFRVRYGYGRPAHVDFPPGHARRRPHRATALAEAVPAPATGRKGGPPGLAAALEGGQEVRKLAMG
jgi:hypothetical protein